MRSNFKALATVLIVQAIGAVLWAQSPRLDQILPDLPGDEWVSLTNQQRISRRADDYRDLHLLPKIAEADSIRRSLRSADPNVLSESLLLINKGADDRDVRYFYNSFRRVGDLVNVDYLNVDSGKRHDPFEFSHCVARPGSEKVLPDPLIPAGEPIPAEDTIYVWQFLKPIGDMYFTYTYRLSRNMLRISVENVTSLKYGIFPVIGKGKFVSELILVFGDDYLLFYGIGAVKVFNPMNILGDKIDPFFYRIDGTFDWYNTSFLQPWVKGDLGE